MVTLYLFILKIFSFLINIFNLYNVYVLYPGPTHAMALYLEMFHQLPDRFVTGTDFVSSNGSKVDYPGLKRGNGCVKDKKNHARQVTDTSSINMFFNDEAFQKIVLGGNYFRITRLEDTFTPPQVCEEKASERNNTGNRNKSRRKK